MEFIHDHLGTNKNIFRRLKEISKRLFDLSTLSRVEFEYILSSLFTRLKSI